MSREIPEPPKPHDVNAFLQKRGYEVIGEKGTLSGISGGSLPVLEIYVYGHEEWEGHTWYQMECSLNEVSKPCKWEVQRRLLHLRKSLHDPVKEMLGLAYKFHFSHAVFASHGGIPGTTTQLRDWHRALAKCINTGGADAALVALVLSFLAVPDVSQAHELDGMRHCEEGALSNTGGGAFVEGSACDSRGEDSSGQATSKQALEDTLAQVELAEEDGCTKQSVTT
mmetsp:Transcript_10756/g.19911  ORF Transcript_10756/g.19911 Transcript_10756/m.19911 type:complete len:225 (-) Transcript_10756:16-690(-)